MKAFLVFPHQLFKDTLQLKKYDSIFLIENDLFFNQYSFHKQKIILHRSSMKYYEELLKNQKLNVHYIDAREKESKVSYLIEKIHKENYTQIELFNPHDYWLEKQLVQSANKCNITIEFLPSPNFINNKKTDIELLGKRRPFYQTGFYTAQRKSRNILIDNNSQPEGGSWTYDVENRKKIPKNTPIPPIHFFKSNQWIEEAVAYTEKHFNNNIGSSSSPFVYNKEKIYYPCTHEEAEKALELFINEKLDLFGIYEDAMLTKESTLFHSVMSPLLNIGLLSPQEFIEKLLAAYKKKKVPINSIEGIIRQIMGWREFVQLTYQAIGSTQRTKNFWGFKNPMPKSLYDGTTGIHPIDTTIHKLLNSAYSHHIERLMVLGNFMLLCEINPDHVYKWFMEMYIDAYDWVMVPNVYGMSQFSDGGMITSKPYIAGSNYLMKMGDFEKGAWQETWDGLFWRFLSTYRNVFSKNPRWAMLLKTWDKMDEIKKSAHLQKAEKFLNKLHKRA
ncbi:MAG: cryptochrome/photolyase family protein [Bacteroidota bacterium]